MYHFNKLNLLLNISIFLTSPVVFAAPDADLHSGKIILSDRDGHHGGGHHGGGHHSGGHHSGEHHGGGHHSGYHGHHDVHHGHHNRYHGHHGHRWYPGWQNVFWFPDVYFWQNNQQCYKSCYRNKWGNRTCNVQCGY